MANPVRILTAAGWQDLTSTQGPAGAVQVYEQPGTPTEPVDNGALWIDTDEDLGAYQPVPPTAGKNGQWLKVSSGAAVWDPIDIADVVGLEAALAVPPWIEVGTFLNGWTNYGVGTYPTVAYYIDREVVRFKGLIKPGTIGSPAFNLPVAYRPANRYVHMVVAASPAGSFDACRITQGGDVIPATGAGTGWVGLDGVSFRAGT